MNPADAGEMLAGRADGPVRVKICGLTNAEDATLAIAAGADALGFNFFPGSKRFLDLRKERSWLEKVGPDLLRVAVVVNPTRKTALELLKEPFIDALQLHGDESPDFCRSIQEIQAKPVIKALHVRDAASLHRVQEFGFCPILLDALSTAGYGGTGETFDWHLLEQLPNRPPLILSGGLTPENVVSAVQFTKLRFFDVASGVEENPRKKSAEKMWTFIQNARNAG